MESPSANWLGADCDCEQVRLSGLWNHDASVIPDFSPH